MITLLNDFSYAIFEDDEHIHIRIDDKTSGGNDFHLKFSLDKSLKHLWRSDDDGQWIVLLDSLTKSIINQPYADMPAYLVQHRDVTVYHPNHDAAHALRRMTYCRFLLQLSQDSTHADIGQHKITLAREAMAAIELAGFLLRSGRTNERSSERDQTNTLRSARIFAIVASALNFSEHLIEGLSLAIAYHAPVHQSAFQTKFPAYQRDKTVLLAKAILDIAHDSDLVRLDETLARIDANNLPNLVYVFGKGHAPAIETVLLNLARACCEATGTRYFLHDEKQSLRSPPIRYKAACVADGGAAFTWLSALAKEAVSLIARQLISESDQLWHQAQTKTSSENPKTRAANVIKRTWMIARAHRSTEQAVGIHPAKRSKSSYRSLQNRLQQSPSKRKARSATIASRKKHKSACLFSKQEQALYDYLLNDFPWTLKHVTEHYEAIRAKGNQLKSLHQRNRESQFNNISYTSSFSGQTDNIYFTIASPNGWPAEFLQHAKGHEIHIPLRPFLTEQQMPGDKLAGLWIASAWYGYNAQRTLNSRIGQVRRQVKYRKHLDNGRFNNHKDSKAYHYQSADGKETEEVVSMGEETVTGAELLPFLAANVIRELRHMDAHFQQQILDNPKSDACEAFVDMVYEQRNFEALLPAKLDLTDPRIQVMAFNQSPKADHDAIEAMRSAILAEDIDAIDQLLKSGVPIDMDMLYGCTPLGFAILIGYSKAVVRPALFLIEKGANTQLSFLGYSILSWCVLRGEYELVEAILETGLIDKRHADIRRYIDINNDTGAINKAIFLLDEDMLKIFGKYGLNWSEINLRAIIYLTSSPELSALSMLALLAENGFDFKQKDRASQDATFITLKQCMLDNKLTLFRQLLANGMNANARSSNNPESLLSLAHRLGLSDFANVLIAYDGKISVDVSEKPWLTYVLVANDQDQLLVGKRRFQNHRLSPYFQGIHYPTRYDTITEAIFSASGLACQNGTTEKIAQVETQDHTIDIVCVRIAAETAGRAMDTDCYSHWQWLSASSIADQRLDPICTAFLQKTEITPCIERYDALIDAIGKRQNRKVRSLLTKGVADINQQALAKACDSSSADLGLIKLLLSFGYDANQLITIGENQFTPLSLAIINHHLDLIDCLLNHGANVNMPVRREDISPLMLAASLDQFDSLELLEHHGATYDDPDNQSVLAFVCHEQCSDAMFDFLLEKADINAMFMGMSALLIESANQNGHRVKKLLQLGANQDVIHPLLRQKPAEIFDGEYGLFSTYAKPIEKKKRFWHEYQKDPQVYLNYTGFTQDSEAYETSLLHEFELTLIPEDAPESLSFLYQFMPDKAREQGVRLAIAHQACLPVFTASGFTPPVIALAKSFLFDFRPTSNQLRFALAHEMAFINQAGPMQLLIPTAKERVAFDQLAFNQIKQADGLIDYLQYVDKFHQQYNTPEYFRWPARTYRGDNYNDNYLCHIDTRIKSLRIHLAKSTQVPHPKTVPACIRLTDALAELKPANDYADFDVSASDKDKLIYLIKNLSTLKAELIPYQLSGIPSIRLKQYVHMLRMIDDVDHPLVDTLFEQAMDLAIPGFAYLYKGLYPKSPMKNYEHYQVLPRGHLKHLHQTLCDFESAKTLAKADELAKKALTQYEKVSDHFCTRATSVDLMARSVRNSGLPEIIPFGSDTGKMSSWRFFTDIEYQALLTFARQQGDGPIWRALWMMGVCQEPKLYELMPTTELATYNIHCMEANKSRLIPKVLTKIRLDEDDSIAKAINLYVAHSSPIDTSVLGDDFIDHYRDFFVNNQIHFQVIEFGAPSAKKVQRRLFKQFEQMAEGNQQAKNFVRQFFLRDHRDRIVQDCKLRMTRKSLLSKPYCQFVLNHRHLFSKFELIQILKDVDTSLFDSHLINDIFNIKSSTSITLTLLLKILRYLNDFNYGTKRIAKNLLADYLPDHRLKKLLPTQVYQLLAGLNQLEQAPILMDNLINRLRLSSGSFNELNSRQAVFLYRKIDRHSAFPSLAFKSRIGQQLLAKIHLHPLLSERIHLTQQLIFIQNTSTSLALSDRNIANQAMHLWADSVSATLGLDDGSQHYLYRVKPFIDQVFKLASHRDCIKMMDKLACAIQSQFAVSDYLSKLLEPEQHDDYIHTHFNQYDAIASIMSLLSGSKEDRVATLDFLASPINQTTLSSFADFILNHREKRYLLDHLGIEELTVDKQKLIFLLRALYQSFWDFRLQERAVILDSLIISKGDETTVTAHQQAYQDGMAYVAHKLFPHAQTNPRDNFALALLTAYLDTANPHSRQFLLAGLLVTTNEADEKQASIGSKFALLCEHLGPAFVKLAQAVQSNPSTPDDIKADLAHVKGRANPPYRWQLLRLIKARLPQAKRQTIKRVGDLLGSASYNLAINIKTIDDQDIVLGLLREHAAEDAEQGFCHLRKTIQFCYHDWIVDSRDIYLALINEACEMSQSELDHEMSDRQHRMAQTLYAKETMDVTTEDDTYQVTLSACHLLDNGPGYRFLTHMPGIEFNDLPTSTENERQLKRLVARLMLEKELTILLSGNPYDSDRHGNQLRIHQTGHTIEIGLYDFGELHLTPMSKAEKSSIAKLLTDLPAAIRSKENLHTLFQRHINEAIRQDEPYRHLIRFNKAVLALQDFQQAISQDDVKDIMSAILPKIDPELAKALKTGIIRSASYAEIGISFFSSVWQSIKGADSTSSPTYSFFK